MAPALQGCGLQPWLPRQTLHISIVPISSRGWVLSSADVVRAWDPLLRAFRKLQPSVQVQLSVLPENRLDETLRLRRDRGLAPDLLVVRAPLAVSLLQRGLIDPVPGADPTIRRTLQEIYPVALERVRTRAGLAGVPMFSESTLACFDRRRVSRSPASLAALLELAASGQPIGLSVDPIGSYWTVGALGAEEPVVEIVTGLPSAAPLSPARSRTLLLPWLRWLRQASLQSRVDLGSDARDLTLGLEAGRLAWIPCFGTSIVRLERTMGARLGVAPLPQGPAGPPSPYTSTLVWGLGSNSSAEQRRLALQLAELSLDPLTQRDVSLALGVMLPANRHVALPLSSSARLSAMAAALEQFSQSPDTLNRPWSWDYVARVLPTIEDTLMQVMVGSLTPEQGATLLDRLRPGRR
ncbi:MAG: hypothetical protein VKI83_10245 [Synechococcaceae cyanobacterium]|nr:hypothetical protein [Synechococcaceae cyanobacterium]